MSWRPSEDNARYKIGEIYMDKKTGMRWIMNANGDFYQADITLPSNQLPYLIDMFQKIVDG